MFQFSYSESDPMMFTGASFWVFFMAVLLIYSAVYRAKAWRNAFLFIVSIYFYYKCGGHYFVLLLASILINYLVGMWIGNTERRSGRKLLLALGVTANLLMLCYFKYATLFVGWLNDLLGTSWKVHNLLAAWTNSIAGTHFDISQILLPVGISFFTFQAISYLVDVYRTKAPVVRNILDFGFYLSFFPQLVAGPIVRAASFIPQMQQPYHLRREEMGHALFLITGGLIKKMVISDYISINFVDRVFDQPTLYSGFECLMAVYGYALQIYCDFSGYTDIAIGLALLMGFRLTVNFNSPYHAASISEFWRRWHISLSSWLRDYLYIPLGGNRKGSLRTNLNLMITMLLGGLWHGANIRFVLWGGLHGIGLVFHKAWSQLFPSNQIAPHPLRTFVGWLITFHFVTFCWIFFRSADMQTAGTLIRRLASPTPLATIGDIVSGYHAVFAVMILGFLLHWLPMQWKEYLRGRYIRTHVIVKVLAAVVLFFLIYQMKSSVLQPFVYFRF